MQEELKTQTEQIFKEIDCKLTVLRGIQRQRNKIEIKILNILKKNDDYFPGSQVNYKLTLKNYSQMDICSQQ